MNDRSRTWVLGGAIVAFLLLAGCSGDHERAEHPHPAHVEPIEGSANRRFKNTLTRSLKPNWSLLT